ncbi:hypothetical protein [Streptomyces sp. NPDC058268]|uniref:hypothetical protein n=1 Tax=Streptomyces sp. NPDC058268 TaxID=3346413 RepID=UPI0036EC9DF7
MRAAINDWSLSAFDTYFTAVARQRAHACAERAVVIVTTERGVRQWHASREAAVLGMLAAAEEAAPLEDRPWHAGRLDAYAEQRGPAPGCPC